MKAIVLSAGQGSRLLPLTNDRPKCLLPVGARTVLQWQLDALCQAREVEEIIVVTGFRADMVERAIAEMTHLKTPVRTLYNPFFKVADNLASCWMARESMDGDFVIVNGDSLFDVEVLSKVLAGAVAPINLTINRKASFDSDDMKVTLTGDRVEAVGKTLLPKDTHAESIGIVVFRGEGSDLFRKTVEQSMCEGWGVSAWYLQVIDRLSKTVVVSAVDIGDLEWGEIDFPSDLEAAQTLALHWQKLRVVATA